MKGAWSIRTNENEYFDKFLVQSYIGETRLLVIEGEEMGEVISFLLRTSLDTLNNSMLLFVICYLFYVCIIHGTDGVCYRIFM